MSRKSIILLSAAAGLSAGFAVRWLQHGPTEVTASAAAPGSMAADAKKAESATAAQPGGRTLTPLAAHLEQQLAVSSGVSRWLEWMAALEKAKPGDFPDLARLAKGNSVALRMVAARWIELDRRHLFNTLLAESGNVKLAAKARGFPLMELGQQLFEGWSKVDPAAAIAALSHPDFPHHMKDLRYTALNAVMTTDPELGLKTMSEWQVTNYGTGTSGIARWAAANPRHAAEFALAHPAGYTTKTAMEVIGKAWATSDPAAAMSFAAGVNGPYGEALAGGIIKAWAASDLNKAATWLAAADAPARNRLSGPMVEIWAKTDTAAAMDWIQQHLTGRGMDEAVGSVLKGAAETSLPAAAALVAGMDSSASRAKAALSVAKQWWPAYQSGKPAPAEAVTWLSSLDPASIKHVVELMQWQWAGSDAKGLADFLASPAGQHASEHSLHAAARELARSNPQEAMTWAARLPEGQRDGAALTAFNTWRDAQPALAMAWLRQLPVSDPRREAWHLSMVGEIVQNQEAAAAVAKTLASGNTAAAVRAVQGLTIPDGQKQKLLDRLQLR
jgi:hypothetical protein